MHFRRSCNSLQILWSSGRSWLSITLAPEMGSTFLGHLNMVWWWDRVNQGQLDIERGQRPTSQTKAIFSEKWSKCQILMIRVLILASNILQRPISSLYSSHPLWYLEPLLSSKLAMVNTNFQCRIKLPAFRDEIFKQKEQKHTRDYDNKVSYDMMMIAYSVTRF